jgi:hypothetical protein
MKKYIFLSLVLFSATTFAQVRYSVQAGVAHSAVSGTGRVVYFEGPPSYSGSTNFTAGVSLSMPLYKKLQYEAGLWYCGKGDSYVLPVIPDGGGGGQRQLHYVVLSQDAVLQLPAHKNFSLGAGMGLWAGMAAAGHFSQQRGTISGPRYTSGSIKFGSNSFNRFDAGATVLLRAQYQKIQLTGRFCPSFVNYHAGEKIRFTTVATTIGYVF